MSDVFMMGAEQRLERVEAGKANATRVTSERQIPELYRDIEER
jgi:hypothetical protein